MNKTLTTIFGLAVACATGALHAQQTQGDAQAGAGKIAMCIGCHGIPGYQSSFPEVHKVPMISGQGAGYIAAALQAYKKGERRHPTMRGIAQSLSDQDIADMAAYYAAHGKQGATPPDRPGREPSAQVAQLLQKGACVSCHGENFAKPIDPSYPKIAGQHGDYLFVALKSYKVDNGAYVGRSNAVMAGIARQFSNAELKALAGYVSALQGDLQVVPQPRFR
ncbi:c-type cytochrome [Diaphorobacter sp.]|uniref:c-type cytochrome n=1 Tax=Diaphorobacter sp. TaxID=1934310 RepID=UPI003D131503